VLAIGLAPVIDVFLICLPSKVAIIFIPCCLLRL
jgi:hypothetical protein